MRFVGWNQALEEAGRGQDARSCAQAQDLMLRSPIADGARGAGIGCGARDQQSPGRDPGAGAAAAGGPARGIHPARSMVKDIEQQAQRIRGIVKNLLRFVQRQAGEGFQPVDPRGCWRMRWSCAAPASWPPPASRWFAGWPRHPPSFGETSRSCKRRSSSSSRTREGSHPRGGTLTVDSRPRCGPGAGRRH